MIARRVGLLWPLGLALLLAGAWPVIAYRVHPAVLPALLAAATIAALVARRPATGIALVLVLAPFTNADLGGGRPVRFLVSGLAVALLLYGLLVERSGAQRPARGLQLAVLAFVAAAGLSSLAAHDPSASVNRFLGVLVAAVLFLAVIQICRRRDQLLVVVSGAVVGLLVAGAQGLVQKLTGRLSSAGVVVGDEVVGRVAGSFSHPNQYAGYLIALIPLAAALAVDKRAAGRLRVPAAAAAALALVALAFSFTRGAILGLVGGSLIWLAVVRPRAAVGAAVAVAVGGVLLAPAALKDRLTDPAGGDLGLREDLWRSALDLYRSEPVVGVGLGNFGEAYGRLPATVSAGSQRRLLHQSQILVPPHANNLFLTILAEEGLIGALAFLGLLGSALWSCRRAAHADERLRRALGIGVGAGLCALLVHSLLEYTLFGEVALPIFALLGVLAVLGADERAESG
jgi:putative inorganic carbon (HCO3(-)) transporter